MRIHNHLYQLNFQFDQNTKIHPCERPLKAFRRSLFKGFFGLIFCLISIAAVSANPGKPVISKGKSGPNRTKITWTQNLDSTLYYQIFRKKAGGSFQFLDSTTQLHYVDTLATAGFEYDYTIRAVDTLGILGSFSDTIQVVPNRIWWVDVAGVDSAFFGFKDEPFASVQFALNKLVSGDTIILKNGTYSDPISINKSVTIGSQWLLTGDSAYSNNTYLDGNSAHRIVAVQTTGSSKVNIQGLKLTRGKASKGAAVRASLSASDTLRFQNVQFLKNRADSAGTSLYLEGSNSGVTLVQNCIIGQDTGKSIIKIHGSELNIQFSTIAHNKLIGLIDTAIIVEGSKVNVSNSILHAVTYHHYPIRSVASYGSSQLNVAYSNIYNGWSGTGNIDAEPEFLSGTFIPSKFSPGIARATSVSGLSKDINGTDRPFPSGSLPDMGAVESEFVQTIPKIKYILSDYDTFFIYPSIWQPEFKSKVFIEISDVNKNPIKYDSVSTILGQYTYEFSEGTLENGKYYYFRVFQGETLSDKDLANTQFSDYKLSKINLTAYNCRGLLDSAFTPTAQQCLNGNQFVIYNRSVDTAGYSIVSKQWNYWGSLLSQQTSVTDTLKLNLSDSGTYYASITVKNNKGCIKSDTVKFYVANNPKADFSINDTAQCSVNQKFVFSSLSKSNIKNSTSLSLNWDMGDSSYTSKINPINIYNSSGPRTITLIASNKYSCRDTVSKRIMIAPMPVAGIFVADSALCFTGNQFHLNSNSSINSGGGSLQYTWRFEDYNSIKQKWESSAATSLNTSKDSATKQFSQTGYKRVWLKATSSYGCKDSVYEQLHVIKEPQVKFTTNSNQICFGSTPSIINDLSTIGEVSINTWTVNWGDGNGGSKSVSDTFTHNYSDTGKYTIQLSIMDTRGCTDTLSSQVFIAPNPVADFSLNDSTQCLSGNSFDITQNSTSNVASAVLNYVWDFGDATSSSLSSPKKSYTTKGLYGIELKATNIFGCADSLTKSVRVYGLPQVKFSVSDTQFCENNGSVNFLNTSNIAAGEGVLTWMWKLGNGNSDTAKSPSTTYTSVGKPNVKLMATSTFGCQDSASLELEVIKKPAIQIVAVNDSCLNSGVQLKARDLNNLKPHSVKWVFSDNTQSNDSNLVKYFSTEGLKNYDLIVGNSRGCYDTVKGNLRLYNNPNAEFNVLLDKQCYKGNEFAFKDSTDYLYGTSQRTNYWFFGDANSDTLLNVNTLEHTYAAAGVYQVKLVAINGFGCADTALKQITVYPMPVAKFTIADSLQCLKGNRYEFVNLSQSKTTSAALNYSWEFGDTTQSGLTSPEKKYFTDGERTIQLAVENIHGCRDTFESKLRVYPQSIPDFSINNSSQCVNNNLFEYTSNSTIKTGGGSLSFAWNLGQGKTDTGSTVDVVYSQKGNTKVTLISTTSFGCKDTLEKSIVLLDKPQALISKLNSDSCLNNSWKFKVVDLKSSTISGIEWKFNDLSVYSDSIIEKKFTTSGSKSAQIIIANSNGCTDTVQRNWVVYYNPVSGFNIQDDSLCLKGNQFNFTNTSTTLSGAVSGFSWTFGDGKAGSNQQHPKYSYTDTGNYSVRFEVTSSLGCKDTAWRILRVKSNPKSSFTEDLALQCLHTNSTQFTNNSTSQTVGSALTHYWNFGDTTQSSLKNPSKSYLQAGVKNVQLIVKNDENCYDTSVRQIEIKPEPIAGFNINKSVQCANNNQFVFNDTSKIVNRGGTLTASWNSSVGVKKSNSSSFTTGFQTAGTYSIKMIATSQYGCQDSIEKTVKINPKPQTAFAYLSKDSCLTTTAVLQASNLGKGGIKQVQWSFADNTQAQGVSTSKKYTVAGQKTGLIFLTDNLDCKDTLAFKFGIWNNPISKFGSNTSTTCYSGNSIDFKDSSSAKSGSIKGIVWNYNDGKIDSTSSAIAVNHSYSSSGKYLVKHIVTNSFGCRDSSTKWITITPNPIADFEIDNNSQCLSGNVFSLTDNSNPNNGVSSLSYFWNFGDSTTATNKTPKKTYSFPGVKTVRLIVQNTNGCTDTLFKQLTVRPQPIVSFSTNTSNQCVNQQSYTFTDNSNIQSGGGSLSRSWDLGDGGISNAAVVNSKKYNAAGTYKVKLTSTTSFGCTDSAIQTIKVLPKPNLSFAINQDTQCLINNAYSFYNNSSVVSGGGTLSYQWRFGDGGNSTNTHPSYSYNNYGSYSVRLLVTTQFGCVDSLKKVVSVIAAPQTQFVLSNSNTQCNSTDTFKFVNQTNALNGKFIKYTWQFGDGNSSSASQPLKSFGIAGKYLVRLKATNSNGCADSASQYVTVYPDPKSDFAVNQLGQCINNQFFDFKNNTTIAFGGGTLSYQWKYQDTQFATSQNASKTFSEVKTYAIKLIAKSSLGCFDSSTKQITIYPKPAAAFTVNNGAQCLTNNQFNFTNNSNISSGTNTYQWNFGDGNGSTSVSPNYKYGAYGKYKVVLKAVSNRSCEDTVSRFVTVHSQPVVAFLRSDTAKCLYKNEFSFSNISSNADGSKLNYKWVFSDGKSDTANSAKKSFSLTGKYNVKLVAISSNSCSDSFTSSVRIYPQPVPAFNINKSNQCFTNNSFEAANNSTVASNGGTLSYKWTFGNGASQSVTNPKWNYAQDDTFTVTLISNSSLGCSDSLKKTVIVYPQPSINFDITDSAQCLTNNRFTMSNVSTVKYGTISYDWTFGNTQKSTGISPVVSYSNFGKYTVKLIGKTNFGCMDSSKHDVEVFDVPKASLTINDAEQCFRLQQFAFTSTSYLSDNSSKLSWVFGDGSVQSGSATSLNKVNKKFSGLGNYNVKLVVESKNGCRDSAQSMVRVDEHPQTQFVINDSVQCINNNDFVFENQTTIAKGKFNSFWDFGDFSYSNLEYGRHGYSKPGSYKVKLVTSSAFGCSDTSVKSVRITNLPKIQFALNKNTSCLLGNSFVADNQSQYSGTENINYTWIASDGTKMNNTLFQHQFSNPGKYKLKLIGVTSEGCSDSIDKPIEVYPQGESKMVVLDSLQCLRGNQFKFGNESRVDGSRFAILSWNFGNGYIDTMYTSTPVVFEYSDTGYFRVELITTTENLCTDTSFGYVKVVEMPEAKLLQNTVSACFNQQTFEFYDVSNRNIGLFNEWLFDKQIVNNVDTLRPHFIQPGKYKVSLISKTIYGCSDTTHRFAVVNEIPSARIAVNNNEQCLAENDFYFSNISSSFSNPDEFWDFGDGSFGTGAEINQYYTDPGTYTVELVVENDSLCSDTARMPVIVNPTPEASLSIPAVCVNQPSDIVSNASIVSGSIVSYQWDLGDGGNSADSLPTQTYKRPGKFYVRLEMNSDKGCTAGFLDSTEVYSNPTAYFTLQTPRATILNPEIYVVDSSTNASTYEWDMNDGSDLYFDYEVKHNYLDTGVYNVRLVVASAEGCLDTFYRSVQVWPDYNILLPTAFSPNNDFFNDEYHIRGNHHSVRAANWMVYNSEGIKVFESQNIQDSWNGKLFNGSEELPSGEYELVLFVTDVFGKQAQFNQKVSIVK